MNNEWEELDLIFFFLSFFIVHFNVTKLCVTKFLQNIYSFFRHNIVFYLKLIIEIKKE